MTPPSLLNVGTARPAGSSMSAPDFEFIRSLLYTRSAMVVEPHKAYLIESRLAQLLRDKLAGYTHESLLAALRTDRRVQDAFVEAMTVNETSFFRDLHPFEALRERLIPDLMQQRNISRVLNIWCAASSSGQEPFSLAMLLRDSFPGLNAWTVKIIATDLSQEMVMRTRLATYSRIEVVRGLTPELLKRHFVPVGEQFQVKAELRRLVEARTLNLIGDWGGMPKLDLVCLRNVLIYFDARTKHAIIEKMASVIKPGGLLMLGGSETVFGMDAAFQREVHGRTMYYRRV